MGDRQNGHLTMTVMMMTVMLMMPIKMKLARGEKLEPRVWVAAKKGQMHEIVRPFEGECYDVDTLILSMVPEVVITVQSSKSLLRSSVFNVHA